jgi:hypothetical protein
MPDQPASRALSIREVKDVANLLAASGFFADSKDMAKAAAKIMFGMELGFGATASMSGIYFVKGRVSLSANLMAAAIKRSGKYDFRVKQHDLKGCTIVFFQKMPGGEMDEVGVSSFTEEDRKTAGLSGDNWTKYKRNMLFARALSNGAKWYCPDVFAGHTPYLPDELDTRATVTDDGSYLVESVAVVEPATDPEQLAEILRLCAQVGQDQKILAATLGATDLGHLSPEKTARAIQFLELKAEDDDPVIEETKK